MIDNDPDSLPSSYPLDKGRSPLSKARDDIYSQIFSTNIAINPLISAAAPIFASVGSLRNETQPPNDQKLYSALYHEIKAFEVKAKNLGYRAQIILAARYLLCALIDETITTSSWAKNGYWESRSLLSYFHHEKSGDEHVFMILERCAEEAALYIDFLELGYLCLSMGYRGKYHQPHYYQELAIFVDELYDVIRHSRGEPAQQLFIASNNTILPSKKTKYLPPLWIIALLTLIVLAGIFFSYQFLLKKQFADVRHLLISLTRNKVSSTEKQQ